MTQWSHSLWAMIKRCFCLFEKDNKLRQQCERREGARRWAAFSRQQIWHQQNTNWFISRFSHAGWQTCFLSEACPDKHASCLKWQEARLNKHWMLTTKMLPYKSENEAKAQQDEGFGWKSDSKMLFSSCGLSQRFNGRESGVCQQQQQQQHQVWGSCRLGCGTTGLAAEAMREYCDLCFSVITTISYGSFQRMGNHLKPKSFPPSRRTQSTLSIILTNLKMPWLTNP